MRLFLALFLLFFVSTRALRCGPKWPVIPIYVTEDTAKDLSKELIENADQIWLHIKNGKSVAQEDVLAIVSAASDLNVAWPTKLDMVTGLLAKLESREIDATMTYSAYYECIRMEKWAKVLLLMGIDNQVQLLKDIISTPWKIPSVWEIADKNGKIDIVVQLIMDAACYD